jgi:hypothetical protein
LCDLPASCWGLEVLVHVPASASSQEQEITSGVAEYVTRSYVAYWIRIAINSAIVVASCPRTWCSENEVNLLIFSFNHWYIIIHLYLFVVFFGLHHLVFMNFRHIDHLLLVCCVFCYSWISYFCFLLCWFHRVDFSIYHCELLCIYNTFVICSLSYAFHSKFPVVLCALHYIVCVHFYSLLYSSREVLNR